MTTVTFYKSNDVYTGFIAEGHACFGDYGKDIICASISVLIINTINSIEEFCEDSFDLTENEDKGILGIELKDLTNPDTQLLIKSLKLGLDGICSEYGKKYLYVKTKEVNDNVKA
ncbi:MAG: ribosomal-processing cysteine protease Prp [Lachnospiraceae bacterium]|nr:ribosomal-processing cysteine protease Prp [Lachnospiraceae bacterium]